MSVALEKLRQGVALDEELTRNEPGNPQWQDVSVTPNYLLSRGDFGGAQAAGRRAHLLSKARRCEEDARLSRGWGRRSRRRNSPRRRSCSATARRGSPRSRPIARPCEHGTGWSKTRRPQTWPPTNTMSSSAFARVFDAKKDWPDAQTAYRVAMKIAMFKLRQGSVGRRPGATRPRRPSGPQSRRDRRPSPRLRTRPIRASCVRLNVIARSAATRRSECRRARRSPG